MLRRVLLGLLPLLRGLLASGALGKSLPHMPAASRKKPSPVSPFKAERMFA